MSKECVPKSIVPTVSGSGPGALHRVDEIIQHNLQL